MQTDIKVQPVRGMAVVKKPAPVPQRSSKSASVEGVLSHLITIEYHDIPPPGKRAGFINRYIHHIKALAALSLITTMCGVLFVVLNYHSRAVSQPKSLQVAGVNLVHQDKSGASKQLALVAAAQKITINIKDKTYTYTAKDLGVKRDFSSLVDAAYAPPGSLIDKRLADSSAPTLKTYVQKKRLVSAVDTKLGDNKTTVNASVSVNGGNLVVNPGRAGISVDYAQLIKDIEQTDLHDDITITASFTQQQPAIQTAAAQDAKTQADSLIRPDYGVKTDSNGSKYASLAQKASWLVFTPDTATGKISVALNIVAARSTITKIAQGFGQSPKDKVTLTATDGSTTVIDGGQPGLAVDQASINSGLNPLTNAITNHQSYTMPLSVSVKPQGERNLGTSTGGKFVLVDIAAYRAYAINNTTVDRTMVVSTGRPGMPTHTGHFTILRKYRSITMSGCNTAVGCWSVPNVPNAEFFTGDGEALHGTYWYVNWGHQNASHGCVNLQLADAAWLYDWTSIGTDVVVV